MKFTVDKDTLSDAVAWVARTVPLRPPAPVLSGVRLEAFQDGVVELSAYDFENSSKVKFEADVVEAGTALVSGKLLNEISKALPNKPASFELDGSKLKISCDKAKFNLLTMPIDEYPNLPQAPQARGTINGAEFDNAVGQVAVAASRDETVPLLTSVRVEIDGNKIRLLSTDRYRLAARELEWEPTEKDFQAAALIKARTMTDAAKSMVSPKNDIEFALQTGSGIEMAGFAVAGKQSTSQLIDGEYPPVMRLFPEQTPIHAVVSTQALLDAVARVSLVAERSAPIRLIFTEGQVDLEAGQGEDAQATETLPAELVGEDINVAFNPQYLTDGLRALGTDFARLSFTHPTKPVVFTGQDSLDGEPDESYRYLLVPIRIAA